MTNIKRACVTFGVIVGLAGVAASAPPAQLHIKETGIRGARATESAAMATREGWADANGAKWVGFKKANGDYVVYERSTLNKAAKRFRARSWFFDSTPGANDKLKRLEVYTPKSGLTTYEGDELARYLGRSNLMASRKVIAAMRKKAAAAAPEAPATPTAE